MRTALLRTLHDLRRSVVAGRAMTLPNCVRLCRRRLGALDAPPVEYARTLDRLIAIYLAHQPFRSGPQVLRLIEERP